MARRSKEKRRSSMLKSIKVPLITPLSLSTERLMNFQGRRLVT
jgi:hypothetical protein